MPGFVVHNNAIGDKMGKPFRILHFILFCFPASGCGPDPCSDPISPEDYAACGPLCNESSATAAACHLEKPGYPSGIFRSDYENLREQSVTGYSRIDDFWFMGETGEGIVEILNMPLAGVASTRPAPQLRASDVRPQPGISEVSLYLRYFIGEGGCVFEVASVMSWKMRDQSGEYLALPFVRSSVVLSREGDCSDTLYRHLNPGFAWKTGGQIRRLGYDPCPPPDDNPLPEAKDVPPRDCSSDGWCNPACDFDPDCRCLRDGVCDQDCDYDPDCECGEDGICDRRCPADPDCRCAADGRCEQDCANDPDCRCIEDGICDQGCGTRDPDCLCAADGRCNCDCLQGDPDCNCAPDGACNPICGWIDDDCRCLPDSMCNQECAETDPDCAENPQ
jgi:hypothetical protein